MKNKNLLNVSFFLITTAMGAYPLIKRHLDQHHLTKEEPTPLTLNEGLALLQKINGEWYCSEECLLYTIAVKDEKNIIINNLTEGSIDECKVSSTSPGAHSLNVVTKYQGCWHIQILDENKLSMQFGIKTEDGIIEEAEPLVFQRS